MALVVAALLAAKQDLLDAHDSRTSRLDRAQSQLFLDKVRRSLSNTSALPGVVLDVDDPHEVPASFGRWLGAVRLIASTRDTPETSAEAVLARQALDILDEFWTDFFEVVLSTDTP